MMTKLTAAPSTAPNLISAVPPLVVGTETTSALSRLDALKSAPISGVKMFVTSEVTIPVNAAPITTATARSTTLPRRTKSRKPFMPRGSLGSGRRGGRSRGFGRRVRLRRGLLLAGVRLAAVLLGAGVAPGGGLGLRARRSRVGAVEAGAVERDADRAVLLAQRPPALRAVRQGRITEVLMDLERRRAVTALVCINGHRSQILRRRAERVENSTVRVGVTTPSSA